VTHLSPYLRHGVLSLAEVRQAVLAKAGQNAGKLINELGWRDYWQRVYAAIGEGIWQDREPYKTGFTAEEYAPEMPEDLRQGTTGLACMDGFATELVETGYLHNHARMWVAAYLVHHRRVRWQAGARWFLTHLLDGDPASNNLSWQWIASTFSAKPYVFNRENMEHNTKGIYCQTCPLARRGCPFDAPTPALESRLFPHRAPEMPPPARRETRREQRRR
jgi:deoxyribodipyrimidine photo-lyase